MAKKLLIFVCLFAQLAALEVREPMSDEIKDISNLYFDSWHETYDVIAPHLSSIRTRENCLKQWRGYHQKKNGYFMLIALQNKKIVGVIYAGPLLDNKNTACNSCDSEIDKLYVSPTLKNQGIGTNLLKECLKKLKDQGFKSTIVRSLSKNINTNKFYEKKGGILIGTQTVAFNEKMNIYNFRLY